MKSLKPNLVKHPTKQIPLSLPYITQDEISAVSRVLKSGQLSLGGKTKEFEQLVADFVGTKYAVAVSSGTSGLHLCVKAHNFQSGDEIITSPFSFVASTNVLLYENLSPVFIDIDPYTFNLDPNKLEDAITPKTKAILPVHIFGRSINYQAINRIAKKHHLPIIEDACEALGARYKQRQVGNFNNLAVFAFYPNKQITTGEGGIIVTNSLRQARLLKSLSNQGRGLTDSWLIHQRLGFNYRLNELNSALGVEQLKKIDQLLVLRKQVALWYNQALKGIPSLQLPLPDDSQYVRSWFVYVVQVPNFTVRNYLIRQLLSVGIHTKPYLPSIHLQPYIKAKFGYRPGDFPISESVSSRSLALPFFSSMTQLQVEKVSYFLNKFLKP